MTEGLAPESSSASRQKSCHACVKGKRGCDKRHPVCTRCEDRRIVCNYAKRTYDEAFYELDSVDLDMYWAGFSALSSSIDFVDVMPLSLAPPLSQQPENESSPSPSLRQRPQNEQALAKFDYTPMADLCVCDSLVKRYTANIKERYNMSRGRSMTLPPRYILSYKV